MEPSVTCGHAQRARVRGVSQFRRRRRSGGGTRGTQGSRAGAAGKPPARRVAVRLLVAQDPRKAPLRFACAAVVCSLSGRRCRAPVSGRVAGRARHCPEATRCAPHPRHSARQGLGHCGPLQAAKRTPSLGGGRGRKRGGRALGHRGAAGGSDGQSRVRRHLKSPRRALRRSAHACAVTGAPGRPGSRKPRARPRAPPDP